MSFSRRDLLVASTSAALLSALPGVAHSAVAAPRGRRPKNVIFCVSDGMSIGTPSLANHYVQRVEGKKHSHWTRLAGRNDVHVGMMSTTSLSSFVTDSAAASTAWGSGSYVWNGSINTLPDGTELDPILQILKGRAKMKTGLVSTATITHATPAGWAVAEKNRGSEAAIAAGYLKAGCDVYLGGGQSFFSPELMAKFVEAGYTTVTSRREMNAAHGKVLGLFSKGMVPYEIDRVNDASLSMTVPSLAQMTSKAIELLDGSSNGFILQIEGARIDHAAHGNDVAGLVFDQLAFEEAMQAAIEFAEADGETLVVVTSDHGNSAPGLIGSGSSYFDSTAGLETLAKMRASYEAMMPKLKTPYTKSGIQDVVQHNLGITLSESEAELVLQGITGKSPLSAIEQYQLPSSHLSLALTNHTHICWSGRQHTNEVVPVFAFGPGSEEFAGEYANKDVFGKLLGLRGLKHTNPSMSWADAHKLMDAKKQTAWVDDVHWV